MLRYNFGATFRKLTSSPTRFFGFIRSLHFNPHPWPQNGIAHAGKTDRRYNPPIHPSFRTTNCPEDPAATKALSDRVDELMKKDIADLGELPPETELHFRFVYTSWIQKGEPPLSEYRLTFGRYKGKRLDAMPGKPLSRYLLPHKDTRYMRLRCPHVVDAIEDFLKRYPGRMRQIGKPTPLPRFKDETLNQKIFTLKQKTPLPMKGRGKTRTF